MTGRRGVLLAAAMSLATAGVERADETDELIGALKPSPPDDAVWAAKLMEAAGDLAAKPAVQGRLYEKAYELGIKKAEGYPTAIKAAEALIGADGAREAVWQPKLLAVYRLAWQAAGRAERHKAGNTYVGKMIAMADGLAASDKVAEAVKLYADAARMTRYHALDRAAEVAGKLKRLQARQQLDRQLAACKRLLAAKADNVPVRERLIRLWLVEFDDPAEAQKLLTADVSEELRTYVPMAARKLAATAKDACRELGDWYRSQAARATPIGKPKARARAAAYYRRFLELEPDAVKAAVVKARLAQIGVEVAKLRWGVLTVGLVLHYDFDKDEGGRVTDRSGRQNHGRVVRAKWTKDGQVGGAYRFDHAAGDTYIEIRNRASLNPPKAITVAAWVMPTGGNAIVDKTDWSGGNIPKGYVLRYEGGKVNFTFGGTAWNGVTAKSGGPVDSWSHLVGCYDGKELRLFCNGEISAKRPVTRPLRSSAWPLRIGHGTYDKGPKRRYYGLIDEVMIWSRPLSDAEVKQLYRLQGGK